MVHGQVFVGLGVPSVLLASWLTSKNLTGIAKVWPRTLTLLVAAWGSPRVKVAWKMEWELYWKRVESIEVTYYPSCDTENLIYITLKLQTLVTAFATSDRVLSCLCWAIVWSFFICKTTGIILVSFFSFLRGVLLYPFDWWSGSHPPS